MRAALPKQLARIRLRVAATYVMLCFSAWMTLFGGRVPALLSPTVKRELYFKMPIAGTHFHWKFRDTRAYLSGELTVRIVNARRGRDETIVVFRQGKITKGWRMLDGAPSDSNAYFGFRSTDRFATAVGDSIILTLTAPEDLRGTGPYSQGTLPAGRWVATGTYRSLYGWTLNPINDLVRIGKSPIAFLECWDNEWELQNTLDEGWMGLKPAGEDDESFMDWWFRRGVDGRRCRSRI